ncbi:MAG: hypothetical protein ACOCXX_01735 [Planctomycetota bacterium]
MLFVILLAGVVYLLHVLRLHVRVVEVATMDIWLEARRRAGVVRGRLAAWVSPAVVLVMGAIVLAAVALARPGFSTTRPGGRLVIVLDRGPGMAMTEAGQTRLARARSAIDTLTRHLPHGVEIEVQPIPAGPLTDTAPTEPDLQAMHDLATSLATRPDTRVVVLTDSALSFDDLPAGRRPQVWRIVDHADNLGIIRLAPDTQHNTLLVGLGRTSTDRPAEHRVALVIGTPGGKQNRTVTVGFAAGQDHAFAQVPLPDQPIRAIEARLPRPDALPADNTVRLVRRLPDHPTVRLVGEVSSPVTTALSVVARVLPDESTERADLVVFASAVPAEPLPGRAVVLLNPVTPWQGIVPRPVEAKQPVPVFDAEGPAPAKWTSPDGMALPIVQTVRPGPAIRPIWQVDDGAVVAESTTDGTPVLVVGLDCSARSGWTSEVLFPVFWSEVVAWAGRRPGGAERFELDAGLLSEEATTTHGDLQVNRPLPSFDALTRRVDLTPWAVLGVAVLLGALWTVRP